MTKYAMGKVVTPKNLQARMKKYVPAGKNKDENWGHYTRLFELKPGESYEVDVAKRATVISISRTIDAKFTSKRIGKVLKITKVE